MSADVRASVLTPTGKRHWSDESRWRKGARMLGISLDLYRAHVDAGEKHCSYHDAWEPRSAFGPHPRYVDGLNSACLEGIRATARKNQARLRAEREAPG